MRTLEIFTQRIFNNLIKQNQNLASDFVLKQSTTVSSAQSPASKTQHTTSNVQRPPSNIQRRDSTVQDPASRVQRRESSVESPASSVQRPKSRVQRPATRVQSPVSRAQRPESSVQYLRSESRNSGMPKIVEVLKHKEYQPGSFFRNIHDGFTGGHIL